MRLQNLEYGANIIHKFFDIPKAEKLEKFTYEQELQRYHQPCYFELKVIRNHYLDEAIGFHATKCNWSTDHTNYSKL